MNVSVCIATYNGEKYLTEQLESILYQLGDNDEVLISDDGSTDSTLDIINRYTSLENVHLVSSKRLGSPVKNFERVLNFVSKDIVVLSDQDDVWLDNRLEEIKSEFSLDNSLTLLVQNSRIFKNIDNTFFEREDLFNSIRRRPGILFNLYRNTYVGCCMSFRRSCLKNILPFPNGVPMHDIWIGLVCEVFGKVKDINECRMLYRRHGMNASNTSESSTRSYLLRIKERMYLIFGILNLLMKRHRND